MTNSTQQHAEILMDRMGLRLAARLSEGTDDLPYHVSERLRAAREQAMARRKQPVRAMAATTAKGIASEGNGTAALYFGDDFGAVWGRIVGILPLLALVAGVFAVSALQNEDRANEFAEIDTALLTDDLPPAAYADVGFAEFLKTHPIHTPADTTGQ